MILDSSGPVRDTFPQALRAMLRAAMHKLTASTPLAEDTASQLLQSTLELFGGTLSQPA